MSTLYWFMNPCDNKTFTIFIRTASNLISSKLEYDGDDGFTIYTNDAHGTPFSVCPDDEGFRSCNTSSSSYASDVARCLILMVEMGIVTDVSATADPGFLTILDEVNTKVALSTYTAQKKYFTELEYNDI
jgi:hypothetical protein